MDILIGVLVVVVAVVVLCISLVLTAGMHFSNACIDAYDALSFEWMSESEAHKRIRRSAGHFLCKAFSSFACRLVTFPDVLRSKVSHEDIVIAVLVHHLRLRGLLEQSMEYWTREDFLTNDPRLRCLSEDEKKKCLDFFQNIEERCNLFEMFTKNDNEEIKTVFKNVREEMLRFRVFTVLFRKKPMGKKPPRISLKQMWYSPTLAPA